MEDCLSEALVYGIDAPMSYQEFCIQKYLPEDDDASCAAYREYYIAFSETGGA